MQTQSYPVVAAPALPADLAALVNTTGAPPADATQRVPPPVTAKPTKRKRTAAQSSACDRDDYLREKAANGDLTAKHLLGWS